MPGLLNSALPTVHAVWIGPHLGRLHAACLESFVRVGHPTVLHVYQTPDDVPAGVVVADARAILPESRIVRYTENGSHALFANFFRYALLQQVDGIYVDCDVYCLKPIPLEDHIFGWESDVMINTAVLRLPRHSPLLDKLVEITSVPGFVPPWLPEHEQDQLRRARDAGAPVALADLPWGTTGPTAMTWYAQAFGVADLAKTMPVFYPVLWSAMHVLYQPGWTVADLITDDTLSIHISGQSVKSRGLVDAFPPDTPIAELVEHRVKFRDY